MYAFRSTSVYSLFARCVFVAFHVCLSSVCISFDVCLYALHVLCLYGALCFVHVCFYVLCVYSFCVLVCLFFFCVCVCVVSLLLRAFAFFFCFAHLLFLSIFFVVVSCAVLSCVLACICGRIFVEHGRFLWTCARASLLPRVPFACVLSCLQRIFHYFNVYFLGTAHTTSRHHHPRPLYRSELYFACVASFGSDFDRQKNSQAK